MMLSVAGREHGGLHELLGPFVPKPIELVEFSKFGDKSPVRVAFEPPTLERLGDGAADDTRAVVCANELIADALSASKSTELIEAH